ncbi:MAG: hypothetical protein HY240_07250 [Actinobacteria bacterium]|nr:hypothetical protein [Actinomycetota bacterium]
MRDLRRSLVLLVLGLAACTKSALPVEPSTSATTPSMPSPPAVITPGQYRWSSGGLVVTLTLKTSVGKMVVNNDTHSALAAPGIYVLDAATGKRIDGEVVGAAPVGVGDVGVFRVKFPTGVNDKDSGMVILLFGTDNYGAFAPA